MKDSTNVVVPFPQTSDPHREPVDIGMPDVERLQEGLKTLAHVLASRRRQEPQERECRLRNFRSDRYRLKDDLLITIEERNGEFVTTSLDTDQYGHGFSQEDAIQSLCEVIEEYYETLQDEEGSLAPALNSHLRYLRDILEERRP